MNDPRLASLGYVIRSARELRGVSVQTLADTLGVGRSTVYAWQDGKQEPGLLMLGPLCDALHVRPDLFRDLPDAPPNPVARYMDEEAILAKVRAEREQLRQARSSSKASSTEPRKRR